MNLILLNKLLIPSVRKSPVEEKEEFDEKELTVYLNKCRDNIVIVFGQKVVFETRRNLQKTSQKYINSEKKVFYQLVGRHLVSEEDFKKIFDKNFSIYDVSTMKDVIKVHSENDTNLHNRSVYEIAEYSIKEYEEV